MFKTLSSANERITELESSITSKDGEISTLQGSLKSALEKSSELEDVRSKLNLANSEIATLKTRAETAEGLVVTAKGEHDTIEARIEAEATLKAVDQVAAAGGKPLTLKDDSKSGTPSTSGEVTASNFWEQYKSQAPATKAKFYAKHKHLIGR